MSDGQLLTMIKERLETIDNRSRAHGESLSAIVTKLESLPCKYCLRKIDEHEAFVNRGKGAWWLAGVGWSFAMVLLGILAKHYWR